VRVAALKVMLLVMVRGVGSTTLCEMVAARESMPLVRAFPYWSRIVTLKPNTRLITPPPTTTVDAVTLA